MKAALPATFAVWRRSVDAVVLAKTGLRLSDLPDVALMDWYEAKVKPTAAAARAIRYAKEG